MELQSEAAARALPAALALFRDATSLGGVESLIEWRHKYDKAVSARLLRVSVGLEEVELLQRDLQRRATSASAEAKASEGDVPDASTPAAPDEPAPAASGVDAAGGLLL